MTFKQFIENFNVDIEQCSVNESETQYYEGTTDPVMWIGLDKPIDGQDWLVLSHTLASKVRENQAELAKCDAKLDPDHGWGLICHSTVKSLGSLSSFFK